MTKEMAANEVPKKKKKIFKKASRDLAKNLRNLFSLSINMCVQKNPKKTALYLPICYFWPLSSEIVLAASA